MIEIDKDTYVNQKYVEIVHRWEDDGDKLGKYRLTVTASGEDTYGYYNTKEERDAVFEKLIKAVQRYEGKA